MVQKPSKTAQESFFEFFEKGAYAPNVPPMDPQLVR